MGFDREQKFIIANIYQVPSYISLMTALDYYEITTQMQRDFIESVILKRTVTKEIEAKVLQLQGLLSGNPQASVVAIAADFGGDVDNTRKLLSEFISGMGQPLEQMTDG